MRRRLPGHLDADQVAGPPGEDDRAIRRQQVRRAEERVVGQLVDHVVPNIGPRHVRRHAAVAAEDRADDPVGQAHAEGSRLDDGVDVGLGARLEVRQYRDGPAEDDRRSLQDLVRRVPDRPPQAAVDQAQVGLDERHGDGGLGLDRAQRAEPDGKITHLGRVALQRVERGGRPASTEHRGVERGRQERAAGHAHLIRATRRREDAEIDLRRAVGGAGGAADDRHLVDDQLGPAQGAADRIRADGERDDEDRHREPRPLAPVEPFEDQVVERSDEQDVGAQQDDQAADRWQRQGRQLLDGTDEHAVVEEGEAARRARRQEPAPQVRRGVGCRDPVRRRIEPEQGHRTGAV